MMVDMFSWPLMASEFHGVSSLIGSFKITINGVSVHSDDVSSCRTALSMSSGSYSGLVIQELVQGNRKGSLTAPKT